MLTRLAIGALVVVGVLAYNAAQERRAASSLGAPRASSLRHAERKKIV